MGIVRNINEIKKEKKKRRSDRNKKGMAKERKEKKDRQGMIKIEIGIKREKEYKKIKNILKQNTIQY